MLPGDPQQRAKAMQWLMWEATTFCLALCNLCMVQPGKGMDAPAFESIYPFRSNDPDKEAWQQEGVFTGDMQLIRDKNLLA